ncbi:MAG: hypothetical protein HY821_03880 [Acidobacteria bacterium]|nr:hypothetical protein [Acidobacteriota bacterium]
MVRAWDAAELVRRHEELLFRRAYPKDEGEAQAADAELVMLGQVVAERRLAGEDLTELEEAEVCGIAGSGMTAVFSYGVARHLAGTHGRAVSIAWDAYESQEPLGRLLPDLLPLSDEDAQVEAHVPYADWVHAAAGRRPELDWLLGAIARRYSSPREQAVRYDALQLPLHWEFGQSTATRTLMRLPCRQFFAHDGALLTRREVSLDEIPDLPLLPVKRVSRECGRTVLALARDTSAARYRELHGFTWGDASHVYSIDAGRGLRFFLSGVGPKWRLPLRAYHALSLWKNGVPLGYFEGLSLFERMEAGFNLYYTFRAGETAYLYAKILQAMRQLLGVTCFAVDPYQLGHENDEGLKSGAWWFYRKLGFRPASAEMAAMAVKEERRLASQPGARTPASTLKKLVQAPMVYEFPGTGGGAWDGFRLRNIGMRTAQRGGLALPPALAAAKSAAEESRYLETMRQDAEFRKRVLKLGRF